MDNPNNIELEGGKFLLKLIQESKDEPTKMATKLYVILQHMRSSGKEDSMPFKVIARAMETIVKQHGLDIEALTSSRHPVTVGAQVGEVALSQVAGSLQRVEVTRNMTVNFLGNEMVKADVYASNGAVSGSSGSGHGIYRASGIHISGHPRSATEATQDRGDAMQSGILFDMPNSFEIGQYQPAAVATLDNGDTMQLDAFFDVRDFIEFGQPLSATKDKGDANLVDSNQTTTTGIADNRRHSPTLDDDVARSPPGLELGIGTQIVQLGSEHHQVDDVEVDARDLQRNVVHADLEKQNKTKRIKREYGITLEVLKQHFGKKLTDAANSLGVARSTLKRICRDYEIYRWPRVKSRKHNCSLSQEELLQVDRQPSDSGVRHQQYVDFSPRSGPKSATNSKELHVTMQSENFISVKVTYGNRTVRFPLSFSSGKRDLEEEVEKRIKLVGNSSIRYEDEEKDLILITCDSDLHYAMHTLRSLGRTIIKMLVEIEPGTTIT
ncbi:uncharacterized protein [Nicotiana tomentosiformis]|uniref:uncharacterized protein isoform X1 n=1 Tax=Nicotiana tomentosiformis TaxID=4098 RepID=UPI00051CA881|nr:uncharacterized protein LOC104086579 [Nicotiana tomentosiformis]XP_009589180.1 uncharacterized protein LOC104086579 [Nicotiana tomentosiformis]XP_009589181.1 uncharacterized protein LOC104086579 [Nicotiana tomentosiformis]XP_009589182.1 uncharacterized protein LOC104086579 [Nicotiana tomentosiformis]XP_033509396.1 uncharacterized protein LOC104086579 [Nicotiana tomentosiformis]